MKMNFKYLAIVAIIGLAISCQDSFLEKAPVGAATEESLANNQKGVESLVIAAYSVVDGFSGWGTGNPWGGAASNWSFGSVAGADAYKGSEPGDQPVITPMELHTVDPSNEYINAKFNVIYDGVFRANKAINAVNKVPGVTDDWKKQRTAELKFLRAHYFLEGKKIFNKIPYIDETVTEFRIPNDKDIWPNIEADLTAAAAVLPATQSEVGRATKGAALATLGKVLLFQKKYGPAKAAFDQVITSNVYKLTKKYDDNFNAETRNNTEGVWVVQQAVNEGTDGDNGNIGDVLNFPYNGGPGACCGFHQPSQNLVNAFRVDATTGLPLLDTYNNADVKSDDGVNSDAAFTPSTETLDPRLDWTVGRRGIPYLDWGPHPGKAWIRSQIDAGPYSPKKLVYYKGQTGTLSTASGWTSGYTANNVKLIRYSDVLLMAAECEIEVGTLEKAREYVNLVRARAANPDGFVKGTDGKPAANYKVGTYTDTWTDKAIASKAVRHERRIEMGMEGHRFFDLVRWGIAAAEKKNYFETESKKRPYLKNGNFIAGKSEYYPLPTSAITLSSIGGKATLTQNPGY
jgi:starch-binding outer membrane protein, SusD/RagB family